MMPSISINVTGALLEPGANKVEQNPITVPPRKRFRPDPPISPLSPVEDQNPVPEQTEAGSQDNFMSLLFFGVILIFILYLCNRKNDDVLKVKE